MKGSERNRLVKTKSKRGEELVLLDENFLRGMLLHSIGSVFERVVKGRFLKFRRYHNFANLFSELLESTFYKEISKFQ